MARDFTPHQQSIIRNYYRNLDQLRAQRLQDLVGEIFLASTPAKRAKLWQKARELLEKGDAPPAEVYAVLERQDLEALARIAGRE